MSTTMAMRNPRCPNCDREARRLAFSSSILTPLNLVACPRGCAIAEGRTMGEALNKWDNRRFDVRRKVER